MADRFEALRLVAPVLSELKVDPQARLGYELMSDALIWSDELPPPANREDAVIDTNCLRGVFRYRTSLMLGEPVEKYRASWDELKRLCPNWPGFLPERARHDPARIKYYTEARAKLIADWEELDANYRRQQAAKTSGSHNRGNGNSTHRDRNREPVILRAVCDAKAGCWHEETQKLAATDAQRVLEAMIAEYGVDGAINALDNQGFRGDAYRYLLNPLHEEAMRRRSRAMSSATAAAGDESAC